MLYICTIHVGKSCCSNICLYLLICLLSMSGQSIESRLLRLVLFHKLLHVNVLSLQHLGEL